MRRRWEIGIVVTALLSWACGAQNAQEGAHGSPPPVAGNSPSADSDGGPTSSPSTTTTTSALGDPAPASSVKLAETPSAPAGDSAQRPGHGHDAGRGIADIRALVTARRDDARACYDAAVAAHPGIEGDIVITWTIDPKGGVTAVGTDAGRSQIAEPTLSDCLGSVIKKIQFAPSPGGFETKASYPFNFHPHHVKHAP
jgi:hypothetical protein